MQHSRTSLYNPPIAQNSSPMYSFRCGAPSPPKNKHGPSIHPILFYVHAQSPLSHRLHI